jgi:hypothetical protein
VGDRIRVTESIYATFPGGTYGEIVALNGRALGYRDDILVKADGIAGRGCFKPSEIVPVHKVEPDLAESPSDHHTFQVGDRIRVTSDSQNIPSSLTGTYGTVTSLRGLCFGQKYDILVKLDHLPNSWSCDPSVIELVHREVDRGPNSVR